MPPKNVLQELADGTIVVLYGKHLFVYKEVCSRQELFDAVKSNKFSESGLEKLLSRGGILVTEHMAFGLNPTVNTDVLDKKIELSMREKLRNEVEMGKKDIENVVKMYKTEHLLMEQVVPYLDKDMRLKKIGSSYFATKLVTPYILKDPESGGYYLFKEAEVAVPLGITETKIEDKTVLRLSVETPVVLGEYHHPIVQPEGYGNSYFCFGVANDKVWKLDPSKADHERIRHALNKAADMLLRGHFLDTAQRRTRKEHTGVLSTSASGWLSAQKISALDAERYRESGIEVTNEDRIEDAKLNPKKKKRTGLEDEDNQEIDMNAIMQRYREQGRI